MTTAVHSATNAGQRTRRTRWEKIRQSTKFWRGLIAGIVTLVLWEIGGRILGDALFAPLSSVIVTYPELVEEYDLFRELATSLRQLAFGYVLGCVVGITVGTAMGRSRLVDGLLQPWVSMLFATSIAALVPLFILLFGFGLAFRVAIVFMSTVWYVLLNTYHGARGVTLTPPAGSGAGCCVRPPAPAPRRR